MVHVATEYGVLSQTFVADAVEAAAAAGWEGTVATLDATAAERFRYPPPERVLSVGRASVLRRLTRRLAGRSAAEEFAATFADRLAATPPDIVHAHFGWSGVYAAPLARRFRVPLVCTFHASDVTVFPKPPATAAEVSPTYADLFAGLDRALVVSRFIGDRLEALGWRGPTTLLPAGTWTSRFSFRGDPPEPSPVRVLFVGRLVRRKGCDLLIRAFASLDRQDTVLDIVGDGPERASLEALVDECGLQGRVAFHGAVEADAVRTHLGRAHLLVLPARTMPDGEVEGSPVILKEALAVGVPVVATDNGGTAEVLPPRYADEIVPEEDVPALAGRMAAVLGRPETWQERSLTGRAWVEAEFDWQALGARTASIYAELAPTT